MHFLDVKTDYAFKKVFGSEESKDILISFLNAIIYEKSDLQITDLTIVDPYNIPMIEGMKDTYVDVKAVLNNNTKVIIEMQVLNVASFEQRILYNAAKNYSIQLSEGENYKLLNPVIALTITDFIMFDEFKKYESRFKLIEKEQLVEYSDDIELIFVELPKFNKEYSELTSIKEKWIYFIQNAGSLEYIPENISPDIEDAFKIVNTACMSAEELEAQHKRKDFIYLQKSSQEKARAEGLEQGKAEGKAEGLEEGAKQKAIEIAKNLLDVLDDVTIAHKTGLSEEEVAVLR